MVGPWVKEEALILRIPPVASNSLLPKKMAIREVPHTFIQEKNVPQFSKKPVVISAVQIKEEIEIATLEGTMTGLPGDWMITGVQGEKYPCKDAIFRATYVPVDEEAKNALEGFTDVAESV